MREGTPVEAGNSNGGASSSTPPANVSDVGNGTRATQPNQDSRLAGEIPANTFPNQTGSFPYHSYGGAYSNPYYSPYNPTYGNSYIGGYGNGFGNYGNGYGTTFGSYSGNFGGNPTFNFATRQQVSAGQVLDGARQTSEMVMTGMHDAMARFARVSSMIEDILRNLHMLFDALFGLGYSLSAFKHEATMWLAVKTGPVAYVARVLRRAASVWKLLCLFFMSPLAGRFSPVALVLRILGLVPEDDPLEVALEEYRRRREEASTPGNQPSASADGSSL
ncbi:Peroxin 13 [Gracilaria domingensis]|nr:Peroxin 13 [Gracilaria domingensis]